MGDYLLVYLSQFVFKVLGSRVVLFYLASSVFAPLAQIVRRGDGHDNLQGRATY